MVRVPVNLLIKNSFQSEYFSLIAEINNSCFRIKQKYYLITKKNVYI